MADPAPVISDLKMPQHVAIIMDGNGRWAKSRGLPRIAGHRQGAEAVRVAVEACQDLGIDYLTLYAFSSENWRRPEQEVDDLMGLLRFYLRKELKTLHENNVRLRTLGDISRLPSDLQLTIQDSVALTQNNRGPTLAIALNYGAQAELTEAMRDIARDVKRGSLDPETITEETVARRLYTADMPDPDLIIRTSGEQRLSNFLLWQAAYAELVFIDDYWPDFNRETLLRALSEFSHRERRYGAVDSSV